MGGGLGLALNCDIRICADNAKFRMPAARLGLGYSMDGLKRFVEIVGTANTADLFFSARIFDGQEAQRIGLVKQVIGIDSFEEVFNQYIELVAINAPITIAAAKQTLIELRKSAAEQDAELIKSMVNACFASEDYQEGRKAFMEKRVPNFQGK
jgi:enoyl-CoA hydratase/carnithine racemase